MPSPAHYSSDSSRRSRTTSNASSDQSYTTHPRHLDAGFVRATERFWAQQEGDVRTPSRSRPPSGGSQSNEQSNTSRYSSTRASPSVQDDHSSELTVPSMDRPGRQRTSSGASRQSNSRPTSGASSAASPRDSRRSSSSVPTSPSPGRQVAAGSGSRRYTSTFGPYLLQRTLGEGEFGKVKLAIHLDTGKSFAIKLMKKDSLDQQTTKRAKVMREISIFQTVSHPYIVAVEEVVETREYIGMVMEYASGGEMFEYVLTRRQLKEPEACKFMCQLLSGVAYLHNRKIVHRDLKLENLLLDGNRNVLITDFGFANRMQAEKPDESKLLLTSCGSPCYAAPELVLGHGYMGEAADIWSCGVILHAMLCGFLPYDDDPTNPDGNDINLLYTYITGTKLKFPDHLSFEAADLMSKMIVIDPSRRARMPEIMDHPFLEPYKHYFHDEQMELMGSAGVSRTTTVSNITDLDTEDSMPQELDEADVGAMDISHTIVPDTDTHDEDHMDVDASDSAVPAFTSSQSRDSTYSSAEHRSDVALNAEPLTVPMGGPLAVAPHSPVAHPNLEYAQAQLSADEYALWVKNRINDPWYASETLKLKEMFLADQPTLFDELDDLQIELLAHKLWYAKYHVAVVNPKSLLTEAPALEEWRLWRDTWGKDKFMSAYLDTLMNEWLADRAPIDENGVDFLRRKTVKDAPPSEKLKAETPVEEVRALMPREMLGKEIEAWQMEYWIKIHSWMLGGDDGLLRLRIEDEARKQNLPLFPSHRLSPPPASKRLAQPPAPQQPAPPVLPPIRTVRDEGSQTELDTRPRTKEAQTSPISTPIIEREHQSTSTERSQQQQPPLNLQKPLPSPSSRSEPPSTSNEIAIYGVPTSVAAQSTPNLVRAYSQRDPTTHVAFARNEQQDTNAAAGAGFSTQPRNTAPYARKSFDVRRSDTLNSSRKQLFGWMKRGNTSTGVTRIQNEENVPRASFAAPTDVVNRQRPHSSFIADGNDSTLPLPRTSTNAASVHSVASDWVMAPQTNGGPAVKVKLRYHSGPIDQRALGSKNPLGIMADVRSVIEGLGMTVVKSDGVKMRVVRTSELAMQQRQAHQQALVAQARQWEQASPVVDQHQSGIIPSASPGSPHHSHGPLPSPPASAAQSPTTNSAAHSHTPQLDHHHHRGLGQMLASLPISLVKKLKNMARYGPGYNKGFNKADVAAMYYSNPAAQTSTATFASTSTTNTNYGSPVSNGHHPYMAHLNASGVSINGSRESFVSSNATRATSQHQNHHHNPNPAQGTGNGFYLHGNNSSVTSHASHYTSTPNNAPAHPHFPPQQPPAAIGEVRFTVEVQRIKNLPGLFVVEFKRARGDVWEFKRLYNEVIEGCEGLGRVGM